MLNFEQPSTLIMYFKFYSRIKGINAENGNSIHESRFMYIIEIITAIAVYFFRPQKHKIFN